MKKKFAPFLVAIAIALVGCGSKLDGTYSNDVASYTFKRDGTVVQETFGIKAEMKYEVNGKDVKLITPQGTMIMALDDQGNIVGPMGMKFSKTK